MTLAFLAVCLLGVAWIAFVVLQALDGSPHRHFGLSSDHEDPDPAELSPCSDPEPWGDLPHIPLPSEDPS